MQAYGDFHLPILIVIFYAQFVSLKETNLPLNIIFVIFIVQYVSYRDSN